MASKLVKSIMTKRMESKMKKLESKKSQSWWWDSHISSQNSKWLHDNREDVDQKVKLMLKLIEDDADSVAKRVEMYYKKRPELKSLVEEFYRMYRALAERYDLLTGELRKIIQSESESPSSSPSPGRKPSHLISGAIPARLEFFLGSCGTGSDFTKGEDSSTTNSDEEHELHRRIIELETELSDVKERLEMQQKEISEASFKKSDSENSEALAKVAAYEEDLRIAKEKIRRFEEENSRLSIELQKYKSLGDADVLEQNQGRELQESINGSQANVFDPVNKIQTLEEQLRIKEEKLHDSEKEVASLGDELGGNRSSIQHFQDQLISSQKEISIWIMKLENEKSEVSKLQKQIGMYKSNLADRDQEIKGLKEAIPNTSKSLFEENKQLQLELTMTSKERTYLENNLKELDLRCQSLEENLGRAEAGKAEMENTFGAQIEQLQAELSDKKGLLEELNKTLEALKLNYSTLRSEKASLDAKIGTLSAEIGSKDDQIDQMKNHLHQLRTENVDLIIASEGAHKQAEKLRTRVEELEMEVERKEEVIREGGEEKREAIRQLCLSLEHYRNDIHWLRRAVIDLQRPPIMAS